MTELHPSILGSSSSVHQDQPQDSPNIPQDHNLNASVPQQTQQLSEAEREELARARTANEKALQESREGVWFLKEISFNGQRKKIVTQNYNGPCSFIAICNILILRGDVQILPPERTSISYDILAQLVGEYLLHASPDVDLSAALTMMPLTQKGMDLNPLFTSATAFRPHGDNGALKLFEQANIPLVHGWLADPSQPEYQALSCIEDYDSAVNLIVEADSLAKGQLVVDENAPGPSGSGASGSGSSSAGAGPSDAYGNAGHVHVSDNWSMEDRRKVEDALVVQRFLDSTGAQLTYHGLFTLASSIEPGSLVALFRNSHLSVLYRRPVPSPSSPPIASSSSGGSSNANSFSHVQAEEADPSLYNLVTDYVFYNEPSVVWERLEDVDGSSSTFVDSEFRRSAPVGGDFAGAAHVLKGGQDDREAAAALQAQVDPADQELARMLQAEEDARAQEAYVRRYASQQHQQQGQQKGQTKAPKWWQPQPSRPSPELYAAQYHQQQQQQQQQQQYDTNDPRYKAYLEQQEYIRQQQAMYGPGSQAGQGQGQEVGSAGQVGQRPFHKLKRKTSCLIM
ncbi:hypothetical protein ACEPAI_6753 [Sanghuangporus weigelae]